MHQLLKISLLGAPQISLGEAPVTGFITRKAEALFFYLVVTGRAHRRDALATLFWPDVPEQRAKKNLRDLLPSLRRLVGDYVIITRDMLRFNQAAPYWVDIDVLQTNLKHITTATSVEALRSATNLYRGEFMEGFYVREAPLFEEWVSVERQHFRELQIQGLNTLTERYMAAQNYYAALVVTQRLLALEPWHEQAHRQQMICLAYSGRTNEALLQYETCRRLLAEELGLEPMAETTALYTQIRNGTLTVVAKHERAGLGAPLLPAPAYPSFTPPPHNLPRQLTPFVGRTQEIAAIRAKLQQPDCVWLTLVGEGGVGKTRLALQVGEALLPHLHDGVWFIPLWDMIPTDELPEQLAAAIGKVLQLSFTGAASLMPQLVNHLREKQLLLILDNFAHLNLNQSGNSGVEAIYNLLRATQQVKVLITSRHRLNYQAEHVFALDGLPLPEEEEVEQWEESRQWLTLSTVELHRYDSIALFVQRATQHVASFTLNEENAAAIVHICRLVEGLPLGVELAATLVQRYTCHQIAAMLEQNYTILAAPFHDLPQRHHSLQATLAYSWQLLSPDEAAILAQCALFQDSFTFAAATAVTGATPTQLQHLETQMLLHRIGPERYIIHSLMRQYAFEQLRATPEVEQEVRLRHCLYFVQFLQRQEAALQPNASAIDTLREELGNVCVCWDWAIQQGNFAILRQMLPPLVQVYALAGSHRQIAGRLSQSVMILQSRFVQQLETTPELQQLLAQLLLEQAYFYTTTARVDTAKPLIQEALTLAQALQDSQLTIMAHQRWGDVAWAQGEYAQHRTAYEQALALAQAAGYRQREVHCLSNLGMNYDMRGEYGNAIHCYEAALALTRELDDRQKENIIYNNLGVSSILADEFSQALFYYEKTLQLSRQLGDQEGSGFANLNFGLLFNRLGDWERAKWYGERALKIFRMISARRLEARALAQLGLTLHQLGEATNAAGYCQQALRLARQGGYQGVEAEALTVWGQILLDRQQGAQAAAVYREAYALWKSLGRMQRVLLAQSGLVDSLLLLGDRHGALREAEIILDQLASAGDPSRSPAEGVLLSCYRALETYQDPRAMSLLQRAYQLLEAKAAKLQDDALRQSFLQRVKTHFELIQLMQVVC